MSIYGTRQGVRGYIKLQFGCLDSATNVFPLDAKKESMKQELFRTVSNYGY